MCQKNHKIQGRKNWQKKSPKKSKKIVDKRRFWCYISRALDGRGLQLRVGPEKIKIRG